MMEEKIAPTVTIYADGSARPNPGHGGWVTLLVHGNRVRMIVGEQDNTTNNEMELRAVLEGLKRLKKPCLVTIYTDSQYVRDGIRAVSFERVFDTHTGLWEQMRDLYKKQVAVRVSEVVAHHPDTADLHKVCDRYSRFMARGQVKPMDRVISMEDILREASGQ